MERSARRELPRPAVLDADGHVAHVLSTLARWATIALPALYLSLFAVGIETTGWLLAFLALVGCHVATLVGRQRLRRPASGER